MATVAISGLPAATGVAGADVTPIVQSATTKKVTFSAIFAAPPAIGGTTPNSGAFTTISATGALTYGGVTLNAAVTGTGNMVLSASPTLTGTLTAAIANFSGAVATGNLSVTGTTTSSGNIISSASAGRFIGGDASGSSTFGAISVRTAVVAYGASHGTYPDQLEFDAGNAVVGRWTTTGISVTGTVNINGTAASTTAGQVQLGSTTQSTIGANGAASALTANPLGYLVAYLGTTKIIIPYYNA